MDWYKKTTNSATDYFWKQKVTEIIQKVSLVINNVNSLGPVDHITFQQRNGNRKNKWQSFCVEFDEPEKSSLTEERKAAWQ